VKRAASNRMVSTWPASTCLRVDVTKVAAAKTDGRETRDLT
jgi:hypothetical protein